MAKYTSNEQYEKDKAYLIEILEEHINDIDSIDSLDVVDVLNLLKQSKWIGAYDITAHDDGYNAGYIDGCNDTLEDLED